MSFELRPAVREGIPLLIGIAGPTGSGKTYSALRLAKGLAGDKPFALIDTENGRALHYADEFAFHHGPLSPPFSPDRYAEAIKAADEQGYPVIVVDSVSHEHAGEGGLLDMHEEKLTKLAGTDYRKRAAMTMLAWVEPKTLHKRLVSRLLQINAHLIVCFRAEQKVEMVKNDKGETEIRPKRSFVGSDDGWIPVAEKNLAYELTASLLVTPEAPGVPKPIKLQQQHRLIVPLDQPLSEDVGAALGAWAAGAKSEAETRAATLTAELLGMADELGPDKRETFTAAVLKNRRTNGVGPKHEKWLGGQLERARAAIEEKASEAEADVNLAAEMASA
jgi:hypothetical protein